MTAINRSIDVLLRTDAHGGNPSGTGNDAVTASNKRENSFDDLLSVRRREAAEQSRERAENVAESRRQAAKADQHEEAKAAQQAEKSGKEKGDDGKALPPEAESHAEAAAADGSQHAERAEGEAADNTELSEVQSPDADTEAQGTPDLQALAQQQPDAAQQNNSEDDVQIAQSGEDGENEEGDAVAALHPGTIAQASEEKPVAGNAQPLRQAAAQAQNATAAAAGVALQPDQETGRKEKQGQNSASPFGAQVKAAVAEMKTAEPGGKPDRQFSLGLELKQWLAEAKSAGDAKMPDTVPTGTRADSEVVGGFSTRLNQLTQAMKGLDTAAVRPQSMSFSVRTPVASEGWGQVMAQRIAWLAGNGIRAAELQLHPQELGPVEVRISVNNDQANIHFTSHQPSVREALEASVHRLREMLENNGLNLVDVDVSDRSAAEQHEASPGSSETADFAGGPAAGEEEPAALVTVAHSRSLVDYYA